MEFSQVRLIDKSVARFLIRHVFTPGQQVGEFGAFGGHWSAWFNDTGLVEAYAYDGIKDAPAITKGRVRGPLQLSETFDLGRKFDWILCMEVGEHMPVGSEEILLGNIASHTRVGTIISWALPTRVHPDHPNTMT